MEKKYYNESKDLRRANAELQKQVEELTEERFKAKLNNTSLLYNISRVEKENDELRKQAEELKIYLAREKVCSKQAVKDTAKEILQEVADEYTKNVGYTDWLDDCYWGYVQIRLCKKYGLKAIQTKKGVEVE